MTENSERAAKVRISDKRRRFEEPAESTGAPTTEGTPDETEARADHPSGNAQAETEARADHPSGSAQAETEARADHPSGSAQAETEARADHPSVSAQAETEARADHPSGSQPSRLGEHDYLDDLRRLQAEFDNYRKRMMREQTEIASRAGARVLERLLPVLDNFERALSHTEDDGMMLVHKELISVLESEGLRAIESLGAPFDPNLHEAVESHEEEGVSEPTVVKVYRTGYEFKGKVLRAAMVVVARPVEPKKDNTEDKTADSEGS
jgi:molecular chaperone GrpE